MDLRSFTLNTSDDEDDKQALLSPLDLNISPITSQTVVEYEFAVTGMSCVACSNNVERKMHEFYDNEGLQSVSVVLLTNKMVAAFIQKSHDEWSVTPD